MDSDIVDYEAGETPMTDYQFKRFEELKDKCTALEQELDVLRRRGSSCDKEMTDFHYRNNVEMIYQILKANFEAGKTADEILTIIAALKNEPKESR